MSNRFVEIDRGRLECRFERADAGAADQRPLVFLHEGLGSVGLWRSFPQAVRDDCGRPATLTYSRHGYGASAVVSEPRTDDFLQREAEVVLPQLLARFGLERPVLIGHSDGATIALIHAAAGHPVAALVVMAPHVFVEDLSLAGVLAAKDAFDGGALRERLARHHADVEATFRGWSEAWLSPSFREWTIEGRLGEISCPILLIQGEEDAYGTLAQLDAIEARVAGPTQRLVLPHIGHSPHLEAPDVVRETVVDFVQRVARA